MKAISIKCPECGARFNVNQGTATTKCTYCGTSAQIQQRSPILERPIKVAINQALVNLPIARQRHSTRWVGFFILILIVGAGAIPALCIVKQVKKQSNRLSEPHWGGISGAITRDLNGDGVHDIIGRIQILKPNSVHLAAFDGASGKRLWKSERMGTHSEMNSSKSGLAEDMLVVGNRGANLAGIAIADGATRWRIRLNEKVKKVCAGPAAGTVAVQTADNRFHRVSLKDGALTAADEIPRCEPLPSEGRDGRASTDLVVYSWSNDYRDQVPRTKLPGISADRALHYAPTNLTIALGNKHPGSRIPMIASYRWPEEKSEEAEDLSDSLDAIKARAKAAKNPRERRKILREMSKAFARDRRRSAHARDRKPELIWSAQVPGIDPMTVREDNVDPDHIDTNGTIVVVAYQTRKSNEYRLTAFSAADGKRTWDIGLPGERPMSAVVVSPTHAMVSRWSGLHVFDITTGKHMFTLD